MNHNDRSLLKVTIVNSDGYISTNHIIHQFPYLGNEGLW